MREVFDLMTPRNQWRLDRKDPYSSVSVHDLRLLSQTEQRDLIGRLTSLSSDNLDERLAGVEKELMQFRRGGPVDKIKLSNLIIMREQLTQAVLEKKFGKGWAYPESSIPVEGMSEVAKELESVDLPVDRAQLVSADDELSVWERYGMKQTPGFSPPSWALDKKGLTEK